MDYCCTKCSLFPQTWFLHPNCTWVDLFCGASSSYLQFRTLPLGSVSEKKDPLHLFIFKIKYTYFKSQNIYGCLHNWEASFPLHWYLLPFFLLSVVCMWHLAGQQEWRQVGPSLGGFLLSLLTLQVLSQWWDLKFGASSSSLPSLQVSGAFGGQLSS